MFERKHSALRVFLACAASAALHSLLATRTAKDAVSRFTGPRTRNGLYRLGYVLLSFAGFGWLLRWFARQPDDVLYETRPPVSWILRSIQVASLGLLLPSAINVGPLRLLGLRNAAAWLRGRPVAPEPEAQGPVLLDDGRIDASAGFQKVRHPENLSFIGLFWAFPKMTVNRLVVALLSTAYGVIGSLLEDSRLQAAYGEPFARYARRTPMLIPKRNAGRRETSESRSLIET